MSDISERLLSILCRLGTSCNRPNCPFQHFKELAETNGMDRQEGIAMDIYGHDYFGHYMKNLTKSALIVPESSDVSIKQPTPVVMTTANYENDASAMPEKSGAVKMLPLHYSGSTISNEKVVAAAKPVSNTAEITRKPAPKQEKEPNARKKILKRLGQTEFFDLQAAKRAKTTLLHSNISNRKGEELVVAHPENPSLSFNTAKEKINCVVRNDVDPTGAGQQKVEKSNSLNQRCDDGEAKTSDYQNLANLKISEEKFMKIEDLPPEGIENKKDNKSCLLRKERRIDSDDEEILEDDQEEAKEIDMKQIGGELVDEHEVDARVGERMQESLRIASKILLSDDKQTSVPDSSSSESEEDVKVLKVLKKDNLPIATQQKPPVWKTNPSTSGVIALSSKLLKKGKKTIESKKSPYDFDCDSEGSLSKSKVSMAECASKKTNPYQLPFQPRLVDMKETYSSNGWPQQAKSPSVNPRNAYTTIKTGWLQAKSPSHLYSSKRPAVPSVSGCLPINSQNQIINYRIRQQCVEKLLNAYLGAATFNENQAREKARQDESSILDGSSTKQGYFTALNERVKIIAGAAPVRT